GVGQLHGLFEQLVGLGPIGGGGGGALGAGAEGGDLGGAGGNGLEVGEGGGGGLADVQGGVGVLFVLGEGLLLGLKIDQLPHGGGVVLGLGDPLPGGDLRLKVRHIAVQSLDLADSEARNH